MASNAQGPGLSADEALARLVAGNERFLRGEPRSSAFRRETLADLAQGQRPYATILGCSDSRVPPEWIFDAGLGELFIVRVAGNILSPEIAGTLQYAGTHLQTPLFVVLGHEGCGAISAALATRDEGAEFRSRIRLLLESILPGIPGFDPALPPDERLTRAVESNVRRTVDQIRNSPEGQARLAEGIMKVVGAVYEIETGRVRVAAGGLAIQEGNIGQRPGATPTMRRCCRVQPNPWVESPHRTEKTAPPSNFEESTLMASNQDFVDSVCEQVDLPRRLSARKMFGEYALYIDEKVVALICDNQVFVKPTAAGKELLGEVVEAPPYPGAKPHYQVNEQLKDGELMKKLLLATFSALPRPKPKRSAPAKSRSTPSRKKPPRGKRA